MTQEDFENFIKNDNVQVLLIEDGDALISVKFEDLYKLTSLLDYAFFGAHSNFGSLEKNHVTFRVSELEHYYTYIDFSSVLRKTFIDE